ncbi:MAG: pyruvate dehydrogenase (acetyl-transferring) E1 component subunit alpha [Salinirussus sp.]
MSTDIDIDPSARRQVLDEDGKLRPDADEPSLSDDELVAIYADMLRARRFDRRVVSLNRQGRIGSFPPLYGQEAAQIASAHALDDGDWVVPSYRDYGALIARGLPMEQILLYYMGHEAGNAIPDEVPALPINGSVGSQLLHATGMAWADVLRDGNEADTAYACYFGDGATSQGFAMEAWNFAGVFDTPTVFLCQNNGWAISTPRERQTAADTLAGKAAAYGFTGVQVDGMDPLAVYRTTREAVRRARDPDPGERRPTLVEAVVYRLGAHSTADDPSKYRDEAAVERWREREPLDRLERFLRDTGRLDDEHRNAIERRIEAEIDDAVDAAESFETGPGQMFEHVFAETPADLESQAARLERLRDRHGDDALTGDH